MDSSPHQVLGTISNSIRMTSRQTVLTTIHHAPTAIGEASGQSNLALADYVAPKECGRQDYIGAFAVTAGIGLDELCRRV